MMKKYTIFFCLCAVFITIFPENQITPTSSGSLFVAIVQGDVKQVEFILNCGVPINIQRDVDGNSPLMEAIIALGEKLMEIETQYLAKELADAKHLSDDFRSFLRSFVVYLIIGLASSEMHSNIKEIPNDDHAAFITSLQSLSNSFFPVISRSAYMWCAYSLLDYGIATGQKNLKDQSDTKQNSVENYKKTIEILLSSPAININQTNHRGESALVLIRRYKGKIKTGSLKVILYQIEQILLHEGTYGCPDADNNEQNYSQKTR